MQAAELFDGFDPEKQKKYEQYLVDNQFMTQEDLNASWEKAKDWGKSDWEQFKREGDEMNKAFVAALKQNQSPDSPEVQALVRTHYNWVTYFWTPTKQTYLGLAQQYRENQEFRDFYDAYDPQLLDFLFAAMTVFANQELD